MLHHYVNVSILYTLCTNYKCIFTVIPSCASNPCHHNGTCININSISYKCECSHYKGRVCEVGILTTPSIPILITNQSSGYLNISAHPVTELIVDIISSSDHLNITPSTLYFYSSYPNKLFSLEANKEGIYTVSYSLRGVNYDVFEVPQLARVIVVDTLPDLQSVDTDSIIDILTPGCHNAGGLIYQCPYSPNTVSFTSSCTWQSEVNGNQITDGVVFASSGGLTLPVSIAGAELTGLLTGNIGNNLPFTEYSCYNCSNNTYCSPSYNFTDSFYVNQSCSSYNFSASDMVYILSQRLLQSSFLNYTDTLLPSWLSLFVSPLNLEAMSSLSFDDYSTILTTDQSVNSCENLELDPDGLYSVIRYTDIIRMQIFDPQHKYEPAVNETLCVAVNLCDGNESSVHFSLPPSSEMLFKQFEQFQVIIPFFKFSLFFVL